MSTSQPNLSLVNGLSCLQALAASPCPLGSREVARMLGMEHTRVNRLLGTLAELGLIEQTPARKYRPGPAIHVLAAQSLYGSGLIRHAGAVIESLTGYQHTLALGVLWRDMVSYLFHWVPGITVAEAIGRAALFPATKSSIGLALLAQQTDEALFARYGQGAIPGFTDYTALQRTMTAIRQRDAVVIPAEDHPATSNIAVTIGSPAYAAIAMVGIEPAAVTETIARLREAARDLAHACAQQALGTGA